MSSFSTAGRVAVRGAGEMATGVIHRLAKVGYQVIALEQPNPDCIRRTVCFAEAVYDGSATVEDFTATFALSIEEVEAALIQNLIPVVINPGAELLTELKPIALVDARLLKRGLDTTIGMAPIVIGLGPGFTAGQNCHAVVETMRGHDLGRVLYEGSPLADTGQPAKIGGVSRERLLRAPSDGIFRAEAKIGDSVKVGDRLGLVGEAEVTALIAGLLRGLIRDGATVYSGQKIGDIDPRNIREYCLRISDKANSIAGGVLEAMLFLGHQRDSKQGQS